MKIHRPHEQVAVAAIGDAIIVRIAKQNVVRAVVIVIPNGNPSAERMKMTLDGWQVFTFPDGFSGPPVQHIRPRLWFGRVSEHIKLLRAGEMADTKVRRALTILAARTAMRENVMPKNFRSEEHTS